MATARPHTATTTHGSQSATCMHAVKSAGPSICPALPMQRLQPMSAPLRAPPPWASAMPGTRIWLAPCTNGPVIWDATKAMKNDHHWPRIWGSARSAAVTAKIAQPSRTTRTLPRRLRSAGRSHRFPRQLPKATATNIVLTALGVQPKRSFITSAANTTRPFHCAPIATKANEWVRKGIEARAPSSLQRRAGALAALAPSPAAPTAGGAGASSGNALAGAAAIAKQPASARSPAIPQAPAKPSVSPTAPPQALPAK
mmetsp:Transcript_18660/g.58441  ORF Transcript_18660/g.58441 Transcript_18660/m.58441 type:complete len:256 (+) Transcript_18660:253-1020(+)